MQATTEVNVRDADTCQTCAATIDDPIVITALPFVDQSNSEGYGVNAFVSCGGYGYARTDAHPGRSPFGMTTTISRLVRCGQAIVTPVFRERSGGGGGIGTHVLLVARHPTSTHHLTVVGGRRTGTPRDVLGGWAPEVVYAFTPDRSMVISISTCEGAGSNFDTKLVVFKNSINNVVACFDDAPDTCAGYRAAVRPLSRRRCISNALVFVPRTMERQMEAALDSSSRVTGWTRAGGGFGAGRWSNVLHSAHRLV
jgi:hypothetical protein